MTDDSAATVMPGTAAQEVTESSTKRSSVPQPPTRSVQPTIEPGSRSGRSILKRIKASDWLAFLAILISIYATRLTWLSGEDSAASQSIKGAYDTFYDINRLELANTDVSHMFALPDDYPTISDQVRRTNPLPSVQVQAQMELKEHAVALALFTIFERNFYEWNQANSAGDKVRAGFLGEVLGYFTGRLLRNPRLSYYWELNPGGVATYFERATRTYFETRAPLSARPIDARGPYSTSPAGVSPQGVASGQEPK